MISLQGMPFQKQAWLRSKQTARCLKNLNWIFQSKIYSWLMWYSTARGSIFGLSLGGPTMVKACKSFYSLKIPLKLKIKVIFADFIRIFNCNKRLSSISRCIMQSFNLHTHITHPQDVHNKAGPMVPYNHVCPKQD